MAREDEIKLIAYRIWEEEGCPHGRDCEHWYRAEIVWQDNKETAAKARPITRTESLAPVKSVTDTSLASAGRSGT